MKRKKQTIDSNESIEKDKHINVFSKMKTPADSNIVTKEYFSCIYHVFDTWHFLSVMCGWVWPFYSWVWPFCGWVWVFVTFFGWAWVGVTFFWLSVSGFDLFLDGCGWVTFLSWMWVGVTFVWLGVGG